MKKTILLIIILLATFLLTGCGDTKQPLNSETFKEKLERKGFSIVDQTAEGKVSSSTIESYYIATSSQNDYQIEFYIYTNESSAQAYYARQRDRLGGQGQYHELNIGNYSKYTQLCNGKYTVVSRVGSTVLETATTDVYRNEINDILKEIGY